MTTALQLGRKVTTERDDGTIISETFYDERVAAGAVAAIELHNSDLDPITVKELWERYHRYHAKIRMKPDTLRVYERQMAPILQELADVMIDDVGDQAAKYFKRRVRSGEIKGLLPAMRTLSAVMGVAVKWGYIDENPVSLAKLLTAALLGDQSNQSK